MKLNLSELCKLHRCYSEYINQKVCDPEEGKLYTFSDGHKEDLKLLDKLDILISVTYE